MGMKDERIGVKYMAILVLLASVGSIIPYHFLFFKMFSKYSKRKRFFLTGSLSSVSMYLTTCLINILPDYLRGGYESAGGDLVILALMSATILCFVATVLYIAGAAIFYTIMN